MTGAQVFASELALIERVIALGVRAPLPARCRRRRLRLHRQAPAHRERLRDPRPVRRPQLAQDVRHGGDQPPVHRLPEPALREVAPLRAGPEARDRWRSASNASSTGTGSRSKKRAACCRPTSGWPRTARRSTRSASSCPSAAPARPRRATIASRRMRRADSPPSSRPSGGSWPRRRSSPSAERCTGSPRGTASSCGCTSRRASASPTSPAPSARSRRPSIAGGTRSTSSSGWTSRPRNRRRRRARAAFDARLGFGPQRRRWLVARRSRVAPVSGWPGRPTGR